MAHKEVLRESLLPHGGFRVRVLTGIVRHHWFIRLRWIMAFAALALCLLERLCIPEFQRPVAVLACIGALAIINVLWTLLSRAILRELEDTASFTPLIVHRVVLFANAQMTVDILLLTVILRYSGGENSA